MTANTACDSVVPTSAIGETPQWPTLIALLSDRVASTPDREFLRFGEQSWSFAQIDALTSQLARFLRETQQVRPGDRVAVMMPNLLWWPIAWLATQKAGAVTVPVNSAYRAADLEFVLQDSGAKTVLTIAEKLPLIHEVVRGSATGANALSEVQVIDVATLELQQYSSAGLSEELARDGVELTAQSLANLQYTSGTTGFPKACMLTQDYWVRAGWVACGIAAITENDVALTSQPFSYIDPQWNLAMCLVAGIPLVVLPKFSASGFFSDVRKHGATFFYVLGTMPTLLFKQPPTAEDRDNAVRLVLCSGIPAAMHADLEARWGAPWRELYGMTESGPDLYTAIADVDSVGSGSLGHAVPSKTARVVNTSGGEAEIGEAGELITKGSPMMLGYWNRPEATAETLRDGWLHTGDLAIRATDGSMRLVGRLKDMVRRGGENISCAEVERVLEGSTAVAECAVVPVEDELFGEEAKAFVRLAPGVDPSEQIAAEIVQHAATHLAKFKVPRYVEFVESFPKTPSERIAKPLLIASAKTAPGTVYDLAPAR